MFPDTHKHYITTVLNIFNPHMDIQLRSRIQTLLQYFLPLVSWHLSQSPKQILNSGMFHFLSPPHHQGWQESHTSNFCFYFEEKQSEWFIFLAAPLKKKIQGLQILAAPLKKQSKPPK